MKGKGCLIIVFIILIVAVVGFGVRGCGCSIGGLPL